MPILALLAMQSPNRKVHARVSDGQSQSQSQGQGESEISPRYLKPRITYSRVRGWCATRAVIQGKPRALIRGYSSRYEPGGGAGGHLGIRTALRITGTRLNPRGGTQRRASTGADCNISEDLTGRPRRCHSDAPFTMARGFPLKGEPVVVARR